MKILLTGASGYIGSLLLSPLLEAGHHVYALIRHGKNLPIASKFADKVTILQGDLLDRSSLPALNELDAAYYLVHSMADDPKHFSELEEKACYHFLSLVEKTGVKQIIYLSGLYRNKLKNRNFEKEAPQNFCPEQTTIAERQGEREDKNSEGKPTQSKTDSSTCFGIHHGAVLSKHFRSRLHIEDLLKESKSNITILRASIIIGAESASFKIIRDLVEKLPIMIAPRWLNTQCQPIAISDVIYYLVTLLNQPQAFNRTFEIGGPDRMTFKEMLLIYAKLKGLKRWILTVPVLSPHLSSYWLYLVTKVNFSLASSLVESLKVESIVENQEIQSLFPHSCMTYVEALRQATC